MNVPTDPILVLSSDLTDLTELAALDWSLWDRSPEQLAAASTVVMRRDWGRLRGWRAAGHGFRAIVVLGSEEGGPDERALLEPLVIVRSTDAREVAQAFEQLGRPRQSLRLQLAHGWVDLSRRVFESDDGTTRLSQREADLLSYLASRGERDVSREELQVQVWGHHRASSDTRSVDMAMARLRKKVERNPKEPKHLLTCRGGGYRLVLPALRAPVAAPADRFVGRFDETAAVRARLSEGSRLVTLMGPPGAGKTRLARELCADQAWAGAWEDVGFVDLVPCRSLEDVAVALSNTLGVSLLDEQDPVGRVATQLARRGAFLLVLDNAEHLVDAVRTVVAACLGAAPELRVVVTSQAALKVRGESLVDVCPLSLGEARTLFMERATAAGGVVHESPELDRLITRLDRLPLALELAAARTRMIGVADLVRHLDDRLRWLDAGPTDADPRHRALVVALEWSWGLLEPPLQQALAALATFRGGFTTRTASALLAVPLFEAASTLETLEGRSLVVRTGQRFALLESVRLYAREAAAPAFWGAARFRHAHTFAELAEAWLPRLDTQRAREAVDTLTEEVGNLTAAWETLARGALVRRVPVVLALDAVHRIRGGAERRKALLTPVVEHAAAEDDLHDVAVLTYARGNVDRNGPDFEAAAHDFERAAQLFQQLGELPSAARALVDLAVVRTLQGDERRAFEAVEQALELCPDDPRADSLHLHLTHKWRQPISSGEAERMRQNVEQLAAEGRVFDAVGVGVMMTQTLVHLGLFRELSELRHRMLQLSAQLPERHLEGSMLGELGLEAAYRGNYAEGLALVEQALALVSAHGTGTLLDRWALQAAILSLHAHDFTTSRTHLVGYLVNIQRAGDTYRELYARHLQVVLFLDRGEVDQAQRFFARVETLTELHGTPFLRASMLQLSAMIQMLSGRLAEAAETLRAAHYPGASPSNLAQTMGLQGVVAARLGRNEERSARGQALLDAIEGRRVPGGDDFVTLGRALVAGSPDGVRGLRDAPAHGMVRLAVKGWLPNPC